MRSLTSMILLLETYIGATGRNVKLQISGPQALNCSGLSPILLYSFGRGNPPFLKHRSKPRGAGDNSKQSTVL